MDVFPGDALQTKKKTACAVTLTCKIQLVCQVMNLCQNLSERKKPKSFQIHEQISVGTSTFLSVC